MMANTLATGRFVNLRGAAAAAAALCIGLFLALVAGEQTTPTTPSLGEGTSVLAIGARSAFAPLPGAPPATDRHAAAAAYGRMPLAFQPNAGQTDARVRYLARGAGYTLFLTRRSAVVSLTAHGHHGASGRHAAFQLGLLGASAHAHIVGERALRGRVNYLTGNRSRWHRNLPTYGAVRYRGVWRGIDARFYGNQGSLEYDFDVAPGADPRAIGLSLGGARRVALERGGALRIELPGGVVRQLQPHAYQLIHGVRRPVRSGYTLSGRRVHVTLGRYDHHLPLVIDPTLAYSTYLGGEASDYGYGIAVDSAGAAYVTGETTSGKFPLTPGTPSPAYQTAPGSDDGADAFVTKLNPTGTALEYSTYLGGNGDDYGYAIAVDSAGEAYVTGATGSSDFSTPGTPYQAANNGIDAFFAKLSADGSSLPYFTYLGGTGTETAHGIAVDSAGVAYIGGATNSTDLNPTPGAYQPTHPTSSGGGGANFDAFVAEVNPANGGPTDLLYLTYLGGSGDDTVGSDRFEEVFGSGLALDTSGAVYITGETNLDAGMGGTKFPTTPGAYLENRPDPSNGSADAFVAKLNPAGGGKSDLVYSTYLGGAESSDEGYAIAVDGAGDAYATGETLSSNFPTTPGAYQTSYAGTAEGFVTKLNPAGSARIYSTFLGGTNQGATSGRGIALDSAGAAWVTGQTTSPDIPTSSDALQGTRPGLTDAFVTQLNTSGTAHGYSTYLGSDEGDSGQGIALDAAGGVYVTGYTDSIGAGFPVTHPAFQESGNGGRDAFVTKLRADGPIAITDPPSGMTETAATLNGRVNPNGSSTAYHFEYGTTTAYGASSSAQGTGGDHSDHPQSLAIAGLSPGTTYHYRIVASNANGTSFGHDVAFKTAAATIVKSPVRCHVPNLKGKTLTQAKKLLSRAHCRLGSVTRAAGVRGRQFVVSQSLKAGLTRAKGTRVKVRLAARARPARRRAARPRTPQPRFTG